MEVELKLRIPDFANFSRLKQALSPFHAETRHQRDFFFDGVNSSLSSRKFILRLRHVSRILPVTGALCLLTLKGNAKLVDGVSRVEEDEEEINPGHGDACLADVSRFGSIGSRLIRRCEEEFGASSFVSLGGFETVRNLYKWRDGLKLEVDEVKFAFGTTYEVECETIKPELVKADLEEYFRTNNIDFKDSEKSKFAIFMSGKLPLY